MTENTSAKGNNPVAILRSYMEADVMKKRFEDMLGKRSGVFINSIINVYTNSTKLQKCTPVSYGAACIRAATFNLPIDPALGQAAIIPYGNTATFQIMYKGLTQLCIRTGKYKTIHCSEIYTDELLSHNPITGVVNFKDPANYKMRYEKKDGNVVGHYAYFKLLSGFEKSDYMTHSEAMAHGKKYSAAYKYDLKQKKKDSIWSTDPTVMCNKTVLIRLLSKYGVMSIEMQDALIGERQGFDESQKQAEETIEKETGSEPVEAEFEKPQPEEQQEQEADKPEFLDKTKD